MQKNCLPLLRFSYDMLLQSCSSYSLSCITFDLLWKRGQATFLKRNSAFDVNVLVWKHSNAGYQTKKTVWKCYTLFETVAVFVFCYFMLSSVLLLLVKFLQNGDGWYFRWFTFPTVQICDGYNFWEGSDVQQGSNLQRVIFLIALLSFRKWTPL